jgi:hypothetical protein
LRLTQALRATAIRHNLLGKITDNRLHPFALAPRFSSAATKDEVMFGEMSIMTVGVQIPFLSLLFTTMTDSPIEQPTTAR